ncbi:MAG: hypothetical protein AAFX94_08240 [Myxococcota bacterium]
MARRLILLAVAAIAVAVWASQLSLRELLTADPGWIGLTILAGALPVPLLALRWRAWEDNRITVIDALHWTGASLLTALALGPVAGDVTRTVGGEQGFHGVVKDRIGNTAMAFALAAAAYEPLGLGLVVTSLLLAAAVYRFGWVVAHTAVLTLGVFAAIGLQIACAARAVGMDLAVAELATGLPAVLISSLVPVAFLGVTGRELSVPLIYGATEALSVSAVLAASTLLGTGTVWLISLVALRTRTIEESPV